MDRNERNTMDQNARKRTVRREGNAAGSTRANEGLGRRPSGNGAPASAGRPSGKSSSASVRRTSESGDPTRRTTPGGTVTPMRRESGSVRKPSEQAGRAQGSLRKEHSETGGRTKFIRAKHLGDKFEKELVLAALKENAERKRAIQFKPDRIGKLVDIQVKLKQGKGIGYERWAKKHNLKAMAQTLILLQEKDLLNEDVLDQRIEELQTQYDSAKEVVLDLETRMAENKKLRSHVAAYQQYRPLAQKLKSARHPVTFEEQHRAELTAYRAAAAYLKANNITKLPSPNKLEAEYAQLASEKAKFYEQYKEAKEELLKLKTAKQNVASFFREEEPAQQER